MDDFSPSELKSILHSKRANIYYLEYCRVLVNGGRVEYVTDEGKRSLYWNIPIANTTTVLLGTGTSVTQAAKQKSGAVYKLSGVAFRCFLSSGESSMSTEKIVEQTPKLPATKRFEIAETLLHSLDRPDPEIERLWGEEAVHRLQAYDQGQLTTASLETRSVVPNASAFFQPGEQ
ncbi:MAG TPA: addiction module protein [Pseudomonas sp.]|nr:addiction module protein [Pseudomonas sp.]